MSIAIRFLPNTFQANSAQLPATVLELENQRLGNGQFVGVDFALKNARSAAHKMAAQKTAHLRANRASKAISGVALAAHFKSARFVRMAESQMKRRASVTQSPFDRGLLLGRG